MQRSFKAVEQMLAANNSHYSFSDSPCMADIVLVPQLYNARRFNIALDDFPHMVRVVENCERLPAFIDAQPSRQIDSK